MAASFSTPTMFIIAQDLTKMQVVANVDEADIGNITDNQRVSFTVDAYPSDVFEGTVTQVRLNSTTSSNVVTYEVIVNAPNPDLKLKPGLTANIIVYTLEKNDIQILPNKALNFIPDTISLSQNGFMLEGGNSKATTANQKNIWIQKRKTLEKATVTIGETDGINTEIISGLNANERVVLEMKQLTASEKPTSTEKSPFMPTRPGSEKK